MAFLTIISNAGNNWTSLTPELTCIGAAGTREALIMLAREAIALAIEDTPGRVAQVTTLDQVAPDVRAELPENHEVLHLEPAPMNPVSLEIERTREAAGISAAELARRIGTSRSAMSRLENPFYWGHSLDVLRRVAEALGADLQVEFHRRAS